MLGSVDFQVACLYVVAFETTWGILGRCILGFGEVIKGSELSEIDRWHKEYTATAKS